MRSHLRNTVLRGAIIGLLVLSSCIPQHPHPRTATVPPVPTTPMVVEHAQKPVDLAPPSKSDVKIGIRIDATKVTIGSTSDIWVSEDNGAHRQSWPAAVHEIHASGDSLVMDGDKRTHTLTFSPTDGISFLQCGGFGYRGTLTAVAHNGTVTVIDQLSIDDYLKGVLPREVVITWPDQSLRVQAVASRTYLVAHLGKHRAQGFDLCSDVDCQVYGGVAKEHPRTTQAVDDTSGQILVYQGAPIAAFFYSNCGGMTEEIEPVWGSPNKPYLPRKRCPYGTADPRYNWRISFNDDAILSALKRKTKVQGSRLSYLKIKKKSPSGRAQTIGVATDAGKYDLSGNAFRIAMDPEKIRSTLFTAFEKHGDGYSFAGRGWGHGVGMCQWGAKGQAEQGRDYREILAFYYPHTELKTWSRK